MIRTILKSALVTGCVGLAVWDNACYYSRVSGPSMQPVINEHFRKKSDHADDWIFIMRKSRLLGALFGQQTLKRGDIVSIVSPKDPTECFLKRVIALPNDRICRVNGQQRLRTIFRVKRRSNNATRSASPLLEAESNKANEDDSLYEYVEDFYLPDGASNNGDEEYYMTVPPGHIWVEGDNFNYSYDSNTFGCIPIGLVVGKAVAICYPFNRISLLKSELPRHRKLNSIDSTTNYKIEFIK